MEFLLRAVALANRGDVEAAAKLYHPDAELRDLQHPPDMPEILRGRTEIVASLARWLEALDSWTIEVLEYIDADPWVVSEVRWRATGRDSGAPIEFRAAEATEVKDGQIVRQIAGYPDLATALADLGLEEQAVSQKNIEIIRGAFEAWDTEGLTAALAFVDPDAEMQLAPSILDEDAIRGRDAIGAYLTSVVEELWDSFGIEVTDYERTGPRHVVVDVRMSGRGRASGAPVEQRFVEAFEIRDGRIVRWGVYPDRAAAREAVMPS